MKVPLRDQLAEAERVRDALRSMFREGVHLPAETVLQTRLDRSEAICLTLAWLQTYEAPFREYMKSRSY